LEKRDVKEATRGCARSWSRNTTIVLTAKTRVAPTARWEADGFLPRLPDSLEQLDLLLLSVANGARPYW
jgi:hypothetical protein